MQLVCGVVWCYSDAEINVYGAFDLDTEHDDDAGARAVL